MRKCWVVRLGLTPYRDALVMQERLAAARLTQAVPDALVLLEHLPVYTLGRGGLTSHLLLGEQALAERGIEVFRISRGGDVTFHGPGQLVGYPILDLRPRKRDVHLYIRNLEEVLIRALAHFAITAHRAKRLTGVWADERKVAAIGVRVAKWITSHGFALNVNTDLSYFQNIIPCGITDKAVTSMQELLGRKVSLSQVMEQVECAFGEVFRVRCVPVPERRLEALTNAHPAAALA